MFQQPPDNSGDKAPISEMVGSLVLIYVRDYRTGITTVNGVKDAVAADVHVLLGAHQGESFDNALIFQAAMVGSLKGAVGGDPVLGRIGIGTSSAPGRNAPYLLNPYQPGDDAIATAWITARLSAVQQPAAAAPVPTPAAAATPSASVPTAAPAGLPAATAPAASGLPNGMTPAQFAALPPEVQTLLAQQMAGA